MADFERAFLKTMGHEGGYANDAQDAGGETYRGISRVNHPTWPGWALVDVAKKTFKPDVWSRHMLANDELQRHVRAFYFGQFWEKYGCQALGDDLAGVLFDMAVNMGSTARYLQRALNLFGANLIVDGLIGTKTRAACAALPERDQKTLVAVLCALRGVHYLERCEAHPDQKKYLRGWMARVWL